MEVYILIRVGVVAGCIVLYCILMRCVCTLINSSGMKICLIVTDIEVSSIMSASYWLFCRS